MNNRIAVPAESPEINFGYIPKMENHNLSFPWGGNIAAFGPSIEDAVLLPYIIQVIRNRESLAIVDWNYRLWKKTVELARQSGYTVRILDVQNPKNSDKWNPLTDGLAGPLLQNIAEYHGSKANSIQEELNTELTRICNMAPWCQTIFEGTDISSMLPQHVPCIYYIIPSGSSNRHLSNSLVSWFLSDMIRCLLGIQSLLDPDTPSVIPVHFILSGIGSLPEIPSLPQLIPLNNPAFFNQILRLVIAEESISGLIETYPIARAGLSGLCLSTILLPGLDRESLTMIARTFFDLTVHAENQPVLTPPDFAVWSQGEDSMLLIHGAYTLFRPYNYTQYPEFVSGKIPLTNPIWVTSLTVSGTEEAAQKKAPN